MADKPDKPDKPDKRFDQLFLIVSNRCLFFNSIRFLAVATTTESLELGYVLLVGTDEVFTELMRKLAGALLRHDRIQVAIQLPLLELVHCLEQRLLVQGSVEVFL